MDRTVGVLLPKQRTMPRRPAPDDIGEFARSVEELGYSSLWTSEGWGTDSFVDLSHIATVTDELDLGTSIVNVFTRTPAGLAVAAASIAREADGRFVLGLGAGHPSLVEQFHDIEYTNALRRLYETVTLVRRLLGRGDPVSFSGELFEVSDVPPLDADVPIYTAALGPASRRLTGRKSDGWLPYHIPLPALDEAFEVIETAAREGGRDPEEITVNPYVPAVVSDDPEEAHDEIRHNVAAYVGRFADDTYKGAVGLSFPDEVEAIATAWREDDHDGAIEAVTQEMVEHIGISGTPSAAREQLRELVDQRVVDTPLIATPHGLEERLRERTISALSPEKL